MKLSDIEKINAQTLVALREKRAGSSGLNDFPYYGYYNVDIFDCPPFLMFSSNDCPRAYNILVERSFEPGSMKLWAALVRTATAALDIGAHVGVYSLVAASLRADLAIHAFEANPYAYSRLRLHKTLNGFQNIFEHPYAVGAKEGTTHFSWARRPNLQIASGGVASKTKGDQYEMVVVPRRKLDGSGLAATLGVRPVIKIDVEGYELMVLAGMTEILALKPDIILETFDDQTCEAINQQLLPHGYCAYLIHEESGQLEQRKKLMPASTTEGNLNQFLTTRSREELASKIKII